MHARPAALFVQTACRFSADISVKKDKQVIDGKSILGLLMMAAGQGTRLTVSARGADAVEALNALEKLITSKFGED
jgi:phosphocarrier protein